MLKVYAYKNCDTCRKALRWLKEHDIAHDVVPIREQPPTETELRQMLTLNGGQLRKLFNTSGQDYRALNLKERLPSLSADDAIALLKSNGNLVKRPFALDGQRGATGFSEEEWQVFR